MQLLLSFIEIHRNELSDKNHAIMFTHKPFKSHNLYHRFMKDNMIDADIKRHLQQYVSLYFCGHLHHMYTLHSETFGMIGCPGIQCQIDPYSEKCNAVPFPGYLELIYSDMDPNIKVLSHMLDNWKEILCED